MKTRTKTIFDEVSSSDPSRFLMGMLVITVVMSILLAFPSILQSFGNKLNEFLQLGILAVKDTFWGFHPSRFANAYFTSEKFFRFGVGLLAIFSTLLAIIGIPHLVVNVVSLFRDLKKMQGGSFTEKFVSRQNQVQATYLSHLSVAEAEALNEGYVFSAHDTEAVQSLLLEVSKKDQLRIEKVFRPLLENKWFRMLWARSDGEMKTLPQALSHLVFSFASFTKSACAYSKFWNSWFAFRAFFPLFHPLLTTTLLIYPNYYRVSISRFKKTTLPSRWNGGLRVFWRHFGLVFFYPAILARLRTVEEQIVELDTRHLDKNFLSERVSEFPLSKLLTVEDQIKLNLAARLEENPKFLELAPATVDEITSAEDRSSFIFVFWTKLKNSIAAKLDPTRSRQVEIIQVTERQMKNSKAMARAVRSMLASNLVDKPLELLFILACFAGIHEGFLMPIHDQMFGPNSWFYLSRYVFVNGFIYSVIAGVFSDTWLKIQQDTMNDGKFDQVPGGADVNRSFAGWQFQQTFLNPGNSWWMSQKFTVFQYILPTFKATLVTSLLLNYITLGRFDLDSFIANFLVLVFLPFTGLSWKLEQGFELASSWTVRDIPARLRPHPLVQSYAQQAIAKRRILFNVYYKTYENITFNFLMTFMNMNTIIFGTRSFSRLLFGGFTPVELVANTFRTLNASMSMPAALSWVLLKLDLFLTQGYTDGTQLESQGWLKRFSPRD